MIFLLNGSLKTIRLYVTTRKEFMKQIIGAAAILMLLALEMGCASMFTSKTQVAVSGSPDGTCTATYSSDKEQSGLEAEVCGGKVKVDRSGTLESVVAAVAQTQLFILKQIEGLAQKGAAVGAGS